MGSSLRGSDNIPGTPDPTRDCQGTSNGIEDLSPSRCSEARLLSILSGHCGIELSAGETNPSPNPGAQGGCGDVPARVKGVVPGRQQPGKAGKANKARNPPAAAPREEPSPRAHRPRALLTHF